MVTGSRDKTARIWDATTGTELFTLEHEEGVTSASFSPNGQRVVTGSNGFDKTAHIWDATTGKLLFILKGHNGLVSSARECVRHWVRLRRGTTLG